MARVTSCLFHYSVLENYSQSFVRIRVPLPRSVIYCTLRGVEMHLHAFMNELMISKVWSTAYLWSHPHLLCLRSCTSDPLRELYFCLSWEELLNHSSNLNITLVLLLRGCNTHIVTGNYSLPFSSFTFQFWENISQSHCSTLLRPQRGRDIFSN